MFSYKKEGHKRTLLNLYDLTVKESILQEYLIIYDNINFVRDFSLEGSHVEWLSRGKKIYYKRYTFNSYALKANDKNITIDELNAYFKYHFIRDNNLQYGDYFLIQNSDDAIFPYSK